MVCQGFMACLLSEDNDNFENHFEYVMFLMNLSKGEKIFDINMKASLGIIHIGIRTELVSHF